MFIHSIKIWQIEILYWLQALTALLGGGFALAFLPETRDKTFTQLENIFSPNNYEEKEYGKA